jgi:hypothetical protein
VFGLDEQFRHLFGQFDPQRLFFRRVTQHLRLLREDAFLSERVQLFKAEWRKERFDPLLIDEARDGERRALSAWIAQRPGPPPMSGTYRRV